jgi:hypothetical protein
MGNICQKSDNDIAGDITATVRSPGFRKTGNLFRKIGKNLTQNLHIIPDNP